MGIYTPVMPNTMPITITSSVKPPPICHASHVIQQAIRAIVDNMNKNKIRTWTTSDLYELYISASGTLSKKQMIFNITKHFGTEVIIMHIEGCESVLGSVGSMVELVKTMGGDGDDELDKLVRQIQTERLATPRPRDYDLRNFQYTKLIESISPTLLRLISCLVSGGLLSSRHTGAVC